MGRTRFSGPVYGAKSNLFSIGPVAGGAGGTTAAIATIVVPEYETWYLTEVFASQTQATSNSSLTKVIVKVKGTSSNASHPSGSDPNFPGGNPGTAGSVTGPTSTSAWNVWAKLTATPGEFEGYAAPGNSSIRLVSSGTAGLLFASLNGFIRGLDGSTYHNTNI